MRKTLPYLLPLILGLIVFGAILLIGAMKVESRVTKTAPLFAGATATTATQSLLAAPGTATTTSVVIYVGDTDQIDFNLLLIASSTTGSVETDSTKIVWTYEFSEDLNDWFLEDVESTTGYVTTHTPGNMTHSFTIASSSVNFDTGAAYHHIEMTNLNSTFMRVNFGNAATTSNGLIWGEYILNTDTLY